MRQKSQKIFKVVVSGSRLGNKLGYYFASANYLTFTIGSKQLCHCLYQILILNIVISDLESVVSFWSPQLVQPSARTARISETQVSPASTLPQARCPTPSANAQLVYKFDFNLFKHHRALTILP